MSTPASPLTTRLRISGIDVHIAWDDVGLTEWVETTLHYLDADPGPAAGGRPLHLRFSTSAARLAVPTDARLVSESSEGLQFLRQGQTIYLRVRDAVVRIDLDDGVAEGALPAGGGALQGAVLYALFFYSLVALLHARGVRTIHAACLVRDGHGCLIVGESDSGKSTLTMRLVEQGWGYLTDDSVLLSQGAASVEARPLRRDFCLDPEAADLFPQVVGHWEPHLADPRKRRLRIRSLYPDRAAAWCAPRSVLFPRIVPAAESRLVPIDPKETLLGLLQHTGAPVLSTAPDAASHLDALTRLAAQTQGYRLLAGRDLRDEPEAIDALTRQLLSGNTAEYNDPPAPDPP